MVNIICGLLFVGFCMCYLLFFQRDFLSFVQHFYSYGRNVSHGLTFSFIITGGLTLLGCVLQHMLHLPIRMRALNWIPSTLLLSLMTGFNIGKFTGQAQSAGMLTYFIALVIFLFVYYIAYNIHESRSENSSIFVLAWPNILILFLGFAFVGYSSNTDERLHAELKIERAIGEERWEDAIEEINQQKEQTRFMKSMRTLCLSNMGQMGECYFNYADAAGSRTLFPIPMDSLRPWNPIQRIKEHLGGFPATDMSATTYLEYISQDTIATEYVADYLMTAYLLDRDLDRFTDKLLLYYPPKDSLKHIYTPEDSLPKNYAEALYQYAETAVKPQTSLQDSIMTIRYEEFDSLMNVVSPSLKSQFAPFTESYGNTYWYYYHYKKK